MRRINIVYVIWHCLFGTIANGFTESYHSVRNINQQLTITQATARDEDAHTLPSPGHFRARVSKRIQRRKFFRTKEAKLDLVYSCEFDQLALPSTNNKSQKTTGVILIHPIGVGISRWFYDRLFQSFNEIQNKTSGDNLLLVSPDLLGSGNALTMDRSIKKLPLLNVSDWSDQTMNLMAALEKPNSVDRWCIVANGGCSPIALQVVSRSVDGTATFKSPVSNVILSSVPRLQFFLESTDPKKVARSYKTICGLAGKLFWWYSCRKEGAFIQKFSEKNLVADPANLGNQWQRNCYETASGNGGKSKYSTFAFLAGTLQDGCVASLNVLKEHSEKIRIDVIKGKDVRKNNAKSWFWQKRKQPKDALPVKTIQNWIEENRLGGREISIAGRISLAHEDPKGYRDAILSFLS
eukprot:CAMPEP_0194255598 /NCGR_PEP_ID=MMETSP0158-20130606/34788_1 /TAXON_ID=33649 /ORGANISM="Thalassionema nitzschioides, Strain L26-B" /LENGTH=407 /DNA_ID=CAMNT_0038994001 /DNA_START=83 /DNA_END=1303 /DNA_ORIENTATION=+